MENFTGGIDTNSLLLARGVGGYGNFGGNFGGNGQFAGPTSNAIRIEEGNKAAAAGLENLLDQNQFTSTRSSILNSCNRVTDLITNGEFRTNDRIRDVEKSIAAAAAAAALCCCDAKVQTAENHGIVLAAVAASEGRSIERSLNAANAELTALKTQLACGCCNS